MEQKTTNLRQHHLLARRCLSCGYDGGLIQSRHAERCPRCDCDLAARPARSYAEMEGLIGRPEQRALAGARPLPEPAESDSSRLIERWLLFLFLSLMMLFGVAVLASAAVNPHG